VWEGRGGIERGGKRRGGPQDDVGKQSEISRELESWLGLAMNARPNMSEIPLAEGVIALNSTWIWRRS